jgi:hypothetical protein
VGEGAAVSRLGPRLGKYILKNRKPVRCDDVYLWADWFESADRHVAKDDVGDVRVSTVFLGLDHRFTGDGPPLLFETMIFGGPHNHQMFRCATWEEAERQHTIALMLAKSGLMMLAKSGLN